VIKEAMKKIWAMGGATKTVMRHQARHPKQADSKQADSKQEIHK
jgi:hypothetical protein